MPEVEVAEQLQNLRTDRCRIAHQGHRGDVDFIVGLRLDGLQKGMDVEVGRRVLPHKGGVLEAQRRDARANVAVIRGVLVEVHEERVKHHPHDSRGGILQSGKN